MRSPEKRYAQALFALIKDEESLNRDTALITGDKQLWAALKHPGIEAGEKQAVLEKLFLNSPEPLRGLYSLLCAKKRMALLPHIAEEYHRLCMEAENALDAYMHCAFLPNEQDRQAIEQALCLLHGKQRVDLHVAHQPGLIGGFVLEAQGRRYDKSLKAQLEALQKSLKAR